jgi:hypothetical protein
VNALTDLGTAGASGNVRAADWFYRSKAASVLWTVARLWLGYGPMEDPLPEPVS